MHVDGSIDAEAYKLKREEYKQRQQEINAELENHTTDNDGDYIITAQVILDLARRAKEIFVSSNLNEKQQMLKFFYSNLQLSGKNLLVELHEPFFSMSKTDDQTVWLGRKDSNLRMPVPKTGALPLGYAPLRSIINCQLFKIFLRF